MSNYNRTKVNFYIDLSMFILFAALIGIGILIKFVLIPGQEKWILYGSNFDLTFLGLDRHEWGTIHLIIGIALFVLFLLHIIFHWNMIKCMFRKCLPSETGRKWLVVISVFLFVFLIAFPFFIKPEKPAGIKGLEDMSLEEMGVFLNDSIHMELKKPKLIEEQEENIPAHQELNITGRMTLSEVAEKYQLDAKLIKEKMDLPSDVPVDVQLGKLKKRYGFTMDELKKVIKEELHKMRKKIKENN